MSCVATTSRTPGVPADSRAGKQVLLRRVRRRRAVVAATALGLSWLVLATSTQFAAARGAVAAVAAHRAARSEDAAITPTVQAAAGSTALPWGTHTHVVEGPVVAAGGQDVLVVTTQNGSLFLDAVATASGDERWSVPVTLSAIPQPTLSPPAVVGRYTLALLPSDADVDRGYGAQLAGIDVATGQRIWQLHGSFIVLDPPTPCPGTEAGQWFCVVLSTSSQSKLLLAAIDAASGKVESEISGVSRRLATGLYESTGTPPRLVEIAFPTGVLWSKPLDSELGSAAYDLDYGWTIDLVGSSYLMSVQAKPSNGASQLATSLTAAVDVLSGDVRWRRPGSYRCNGAVVVVAPFSCRETGTLSLSASTGAPSLSSDASATIVGFDPRSGRARWQVRLARDGLVGFIAATGYAVKGSQILVRPAGRHTDPELLDLSSGDLSPVSPRQLFWCPQLPTFDEDYPGGASVQRTGVTTWFACRASGSFAKGTPPVSTSVGILAGGHVVVVLPGLLEGRPATTT
ncbi:MAG TPA: PQQ-binding-like beta-propeller repeat protein [Acidimicrobiales bacterium]|nr:PQQ-binding-like beta-propeller repeat protein [Acidimicrobiales bacterium]